MNCGNQLHFVCGESMLLGLLVGDKITLIIILVNMISSTLTQSTLQVWEVVYSKDGSVKEGIMELKGHKLFCLMFIQLSKLPSSLPVYSIYRYRITNQVAKLLVG